MIYTTTTGIIDETENTSLGRLGNIHIRHIHVSLGRSSGYTNSRIDAYDSNIYTTS